MTTTITEWTPLLQEGAVGAAAVMPEIATGTSRRVLLMIDAYNGGGNSQPPPSITVTDDSDPPVSIVREQFAGDTVPRERTSIGVYSFTESEIATISGSSIESTSTGTQKSIFYKLLGGATQGEITNASAYSAVTATLTMSLARVAGSQTELMGFSSTTGQVLTSSNPTNDSSIALPSGRRISLAQQSEAEDATTDTVVNGNARTSAVVLNIGPAAALATINSVNSGSPVRIGQTVNVTTSNFPGAINSGTIDGVSLTAASASSITLPNFVDGQQVPRLGTRELVLEDDAEATGSINIEIEAPYIPSTSTQYDYVALASGFDTGEYSVVQDLTPAAEIGWQIFFESSKGAVGSDALWAGDYSGTQTMWAYNPTSKIVYELEVITGLLSSSNLGLTAKTLKAVAITSSLIIAKAI